MSFPRQYATQSMAVSGVDVYYPLVTAVTGATGTATSSSLVDPDATTVPIIAVHIHTLAVGGGTASGNVVTATIKSHDEVNSYGICSAANFATNGCNTNQIHINRTIPADQGFSLSTAGTNVVATLTWSPITKRPEPRLTGAATTSV